MSKYSLRKKLLLENEEAAATPSSDGSVTQLSLGLDIPERAVSSTSYPNDVLEFTKNKLLLDFGNYRPRFDFQTEVIRTPVGSEDVTIRKCIVSGPESGQTGQFRVEGKNAGTFVPMKATDFAEFLVALALHSKNPTKKMRVGGPNQDFDVGQADGAGEKWEVKSLGTKDSPGSALTGVGGRMSLSSGLTTYRNIIESLEPTLKILDTLSADANVDKLKAEIQGILTENKGKHATGELAPSFWANKKTGAPSKLIEHMHAVAMLMRTLKCEPDDLVITIGGKVIPLTKLKQNQVSAIVDALSTKFGRSAEIKRKIALCRLRMAIHPIFLGVSNKAAFTKRLILLIPSVATNMKGEKMDLLRKQTYQKLITAYADAVPGFTGFVFCFDVGTKTAISSEDKVLYFIDLENAEKLEAGLSLGAEISMGSPKISFRGHLFASPELAQMNIQPEEELEQASLNFEGLEEKRLNTLFEWALSGKRYKQ